jgi:hypothetical protein
MVERHLATYNMIQISELSSVKHALLHAHIQQYLLQMLRLISLQSEVFYTHKCLSFTVLFIMSIVLPFTSFFSVEDLCREIVSSVVNTVSENVRLVRKLSQTFTPPFKCSTTTKGKT